MEALVETLAEQLYADEQGGPVLWSELAEWHRQRYRRRVEVVLKGLAAEQAKPWRDLALVWDGGGWRLVVYQAGRRPR